MRNGSILLVVLVIGIFLTATRPVQAALMNFGGKQLTTPQNTVPNAKCPGTSFSIRPVGLFPPGPYVIMNPKGMLGTQILGKYTPSIGPCYIELVYFKVPIPTFLVTIYGTDGAGSK